MSLFGSLGDWGPVTRKAGNRPGAYVVYGEKALDGANPTPIVTPFKTIYGVSITLKSSAAPGLGTAELTYSVSGNTVNVYAWKPTSATDPTLIASTGTETFSYVIIGTR